MTLQELDAIPPPITWFGSKSRYVKHIVKHFPKHQTFVDVFGGSGAVLLGKPPSKVEVYNDLNHKLVALFRVLSDAQKTKELVRRLECTPYARSEFQACIQTIDTIDDEIELARMMMVIQRQSHGGMGKNWSYCVTNAAAGYSASVRKFHAGIDRLKQVSHRLRKVQVEHLPWEEILSRYDQPQTLFYLDPPYVPQTRIHGGYEHELTIDDHQRMVLQLQHIKGPCVLSGYANEVYEPLELDGWKRFEIETFAYTSRYRAARIECLWVSPQCVQTLQKVPLIQPSLLSGRQQAAYNTHKLRVDDTTLRIIEAIQTLKRLKKRVTQTEVARMTSVSRVHLSRRYANLFRN